MSHTRLSYSNIRDIAISPEIASQRLLCHSNIRESSICHILDSRLRLAISGEIAMSQHHTRVEYVTYVAVSQQYHRQTLVSRLTISRDSRLSSLETVSSPLERVSSEERWGAGVETQKNVRGEIRGWGRVPFNETYAPS